MGGPGWDAAIERLTCPLNATPHVEAAAKRWGLPYDQLAAACTQEAQAALLKIDAPVRQQMPDVTGRYSSGATLLELAYSLECPPCMLARRLLSSLPGSSERPGNTQVIRKPSLLTRQHNPSVPGSREGTPSGANDATVQRLQHDIVEGADFDTLYSPQCDIIRHVIGQEYEAILCEKLRNARIPYFPESFLRAQGFFKTPDIKLQVPVLIKGHLVNWIDSKATFGSLKVHREMSELQYNKYTNRFGPGAVIYWFGFVEELAMEETDTLLLDSFPREIVQLPRLELPSD